MEEVEDPDHQMEVLGQDLVDQVLEAQVGPVQVDLQRVGVVQELVDLLRVEVVLEPVGLQRVEVVLELVGLQRVEVVLELVGHLRVEVDQELGGLQKEVVGQVQEVRQKAEVVQELADHHLKAEEEPMY